MQRHHSQLARVSHWLGLGLIAIWLSGLPAPAAERLALGAILRHRGYDTIELRRTGDNHLFLFGKVDGRRRSCLIDTGWSFSAVSTNTGARLMPTNVVRELTLGRVTLTNVPVRVEDLRVNGQPAAYDVVLGADFLSSQGAMLDIAGRRLYLRRTALTETERRELAEVFRGAGWVELEMQSRQPPAWTCAAEMNEQRVELLVDSGAAWNCLDAKTADALRLRVQPTVHRISGPAAGAQRSVGVADVTKWRLGGRPMPARGFAVFNLRELGLGPEGKLFPDVGGILGATELIRTRAVVDCGSGKLWLRQSQ